MVQSSGKNLQTISTSGLCYAKYNQPGVKDYGAKIKRFFKIAILAVLYTGPSVKNVRLPKVNFDRGFILALKCKTANTVKINPKQTEVRIQYRPTSTQISAS